MNKCVYCETLLSDRGFFCKNCLKQVKCKNCDELIEKDAIGCVMCGESLNKQKNVTNGSPKKISSETINTFELTETTKSRKVVAKLTDESVSNLSETLSRLAGNRIAPPKNTVSHTIESVPQLPFGEENNKIIETVDAEINSNQFKKDTSYQEGLKDVFYKDESKIVLDIPDIKASGQLDYGKRLVYLRLLYSSEIEGKTFTDRDCLNDTIKDAVKLDGNISNWISNSNDLMLKEKDGKTLIRLKSSGKKLATEILHEVLDSDKTGEFLPNERSNSHTVNKDESSKNKSKPKKSSKINKNAKEWADKWKNEKLNIDGYTAIKDKTAKDKGVFGLWAIRQVSSDARILSSTQISAFLYEAFTLKTPESSIRKSLNNDKDSLVIKVKGGYEITPDGINHAEKLCNATNSNSKTKKKK